MHNAPKEILEEIEKEYENTLVIPIQKPPVQWILMPVGLIGTGKTTVVKPLAEKLNLVRISTDDIRQRLKARGYSYEGCHIIAQKLAIKYLKAGYSIAVDGNSGSKTGLADSQKAKELFPHVRQIFIHINPPEEFVINKLKNYPHTWLFRDADHAVENFLTNQKEFVLPSTHFVYTFDPSKENLSEQIEQGTLAIKQELGLQIR